MQNIYYSNGVEKFGPVTIIEFSEKRYYKDTMIWYDGLDGWKYISEIEELKHLVGTAGSEPPLVSDSIDQPLTPPLNSVSKEKVTQAEKPEAIADPKKNKAGLWAAALILIAIIGGYYFFLGNKVTPKEENITEQNQIIAPVENTDSVKLKEEERIKEIAKEAEKKPYRENWGKFINASTNDYTHRDMGGIENLKIILKNNTPYLVDKAKVEVSYIKANDDVFQKEIIEFDNIKGNSNKELFAPNSDRGVKIKTKVLMMQSKEMGTID
ncbi:MAG: DUF4339 domain-containing protein [Bacteroidia bacterium]|nr:DUF4339 domain-containing protein [Bacteroidia bacterium]